MVSPAESGEVREEELEREGRRRDIDRAQQEIETRRRIEARLWAKQEAENRSRRESAEKSKSTSCEGFVVFLNFASDSLMLQNLHPKSDKTKQKCAHLVIRSCKRCCKADLIITSFR